MLLGSNARILIIDDRPEVAETLAELCHELGAEPMLPHRGEGLRSMLRRTAPDAVIVDVIMPDQDGYEALREIAHFDQAIPVLLITGAGETWLRMGRRLGEAQGLEIVMTAAKPIGFAQLEPFMDVVTRRVGALAS